MMRIIEVGPRDGLQNESVPVPTEVKSRFVSALFQAGLKEIEVTSFVSPKWVPQLGDAAELLAMLEPGPITSVLVPNQKGLERALECGVKRIALFTAASDAFTQRNINMTVRQSLDVFKGLAESFRAAQPDGWIRGYVSTAWECPYAGRIAMTQTVSVATELIAMGVNEVSIGDTIGVAAPTEVKALTKLLLAEIPAEKLAMHFHDTRGTAIANVAASYELGIRAFDSSASGLGGCPYAKGAGGNLATEDLIYFLEREGIATGVNQLKLAQASLEVLSTLGKVPTAKAQIAALAAASEQ
ncbi:MAG: hydroxymethylglutaryl-CoA lyase [Armatimonadetes bacterium]|nr:hydroxymethylglutaryl-CoA lyase [Armatimonadota bacterium]